MSFDLYLYLSRYALQHQVIWLLCQPVFYAFRPIIVFPKTPGFWEFLNWACVIAFDYAVYHFCGVKGICYLLFGTLLGEKILNWSPPAGIYIMCARRHGSASDGGPLRRGALHVGGLSAGDLFVLRPAQLVHV